MTVTYHQPGIVIEFENFSHIYYSLQFSDDVRPFLNESGLVATKQFLDVIVGFNFYPPI